MKSNKKKVKITTVIYALAVASLAVLAATGVLIYGLEMDNRLTQKMGGIFPYPAAVIDGVNFISLKSAQDNLAAVKKFYESQDFGSIGLDVDFNSPDGQKRLKVKEKELLTKMIENRIIEILAGKRGIVITKDAVEQEVAKRIAESGNKEELANNLQKLYGWSIKDFEERIVRPDLYKDKLAGSVRNSDNESIQARKKIEQALSELRAKKDFAETAKTYSEGESAKNGGELGWFTADQMLPELAIVAYGMDKGDISEIVESSLGYHIIQLEDKKIEDTENKVRLRQIFIRTQSFADWLLEQEKNIKIYVPLKGFYWDRNSGSVRFKSEDLRQFEENLEKNSPNDASVLF